MRRRTLRRAALVAAIACAVGAISGPVDRLADASFAWHMAQHMLLLFVAPPLLLLAHPTAWLMPLVGRVAVARTVRAIKALHVLASPPVALGAFVAVLWATHFSPLYDAALARPIVHVAEHALYLTAGILFWLPVIGSPPLRPLPYPVRLLYLFVALPQGALLGFVLGSARAPLYPHYARVMPFASALADQRDAAAVMWIGGGVLLFSALLATLGVWAWRENRAGALAASLAVLGLACIGRPTAARSAPGPAPAIEARTRSGKLLYETSCASCHGADGRGSSDAPSLIGASASDIHLMLDTGRMPASEPNANEIHARPRFTAEQMKQLVAFVQRFSPDADTTLPQIRPGNVIHGRRLFAEHCAVCHGSAADGASVGADNVAPSLRSATVMQVGEAIRAGPGVMPRFGSDVLSDRDLDDIASYVRLLQTASGTPNEDRGGLPLAHAGPVAEGFVAWFFGIGVLVLAIRGIAASPRRDG